MAKASGVNLEDLVTVDAAAALLAVKSDTVRKWLTAGKLKRFKAGSRTLVSKRDLAAFVSGPKSVMPVEDEAAAA